MIMKKCECYEVLGIYEVGAFQIEIGIDHGTYECYEAWLWKNGCGHKMFMFGMPTEQQSLEEFVDIVDGNLVMGNEYLKSYEEEVELLEDAYYRHYEEDEGE